MKNQPIDIRPLTLRGVFGISRVLVGRRPSSLFGYSLLMNLFCFAAFAVAAIPGMLLIATEKTAAIVVGIILILLFMGIYLLGTVLLYTPVFSGTVYTELSARIFGEGTSFPNLFKRNRFSLRRFFSTAMVVLLATFVLSMAVSLIASVLSTFLSIFGIAFSIPFLTTLEPGHFEGTFQIGAGIAVFSLIVSLISGSVTILGQSFLSFVYPVAVNEKRKAFEALERSFKLTFKRFGRVFSAKLIIYLVYSAAVFLFAAILGVIIGLTADSLFEGPWGFILIGIVFIIIWIISAYYAAYNAAVDTVLYFDAKVRLEDTGTVGSPAEPAAPATSETYQHFAAPSPGYHWVPGDPIPDPADTATAIIHGTAAEPATAAEAAPAPAYPEIPTEVIPGPAEIYTDNGPEQEN